MDITRKANLPKMLKGVAQMRVGVFNGTNTISHLFDQHLDTALLSSGITRTDILKAGGRIKRITIAFITTNHMFYDKIHDHEIPIISNNNNVTTLRNAAITQFPLVYESLMGRVPYVKNPSQVLSFSFTGLSVISDSFLVVIPVEAEIVNVQQGLNQPPLQQLQLPAQPNPMISVEVSFQLEYPRASKPGNMLKRRILSLSNPMAVKIVGSVKAPFKKKFKKRTNRIKRRKYGGRKKA